MKNLSINFTETVEEIHYYRTDFNEDDLANLHEYLIRTGFDKELVEQIDLVIVEQILQNKEDEKFEVEIERTNTYKDCDGSEHSYTNHYRLDWEVQEFIRDIIYSNGWDDSETRDVYNTEYDCTIEEV